MSGKRMPVKTTVVGTPWSSASTVYLFLDMLASVGRDWQILHRTPFSESRFSVSLATLSGEAYPDVNGRTITPDAKLAKDAPPDLVLLPDVHMDPDEAFPEQFDALAEWVRWAYDNGALVASVCSGALLLAHTGLLNGLEATIHWGYSDTLAERFPEVKVRPQRILLPAGEGHRIVTAGGASAWADLILYLISRFESPEESRRIAKLYLLEPHSEGQLCYASLVAKKQHEDKLVGEAQVWLAEHYDTEKPVASASQRSGLTERSFLRRFRSVTGLSPIEYVQTLRVEEAKHLLETTETPIEEIAAAVGYSEPSSFRSAFKRFVGISASTYRKKWRGISIKKHFDGPAITETSTPNAVGTSRDH